MENLLIGQIPSYEEIQEVRRTLSQMSINHWVKDDLFTVTWWFLLISSILPYIIWWKLVDQKRFFEILSFGLFCGIMATILDVIGVDLILWGYPDKLFSMIPPLFPADISVIPVSAMLIYQRYNHWKNFCIATVIWSLILSFVIEPGFVYFNMFTLENWKHTYSFVAFIAFLLFCRLLFLTLQKKAI
ncbi:CBO0543 family protein [Bacillus sp. AK128]